MRSLLTLLVLISSVVGASARADVLAQGNNGLHGDIYALDDCRRIQFPDERDSRFFRNSCFAAVEALKVVQRVGGDKILSQQILAWSEQNEVATTIAADLPGLALSDLNFVAAEVRHMLQTIHAGDPNGGSNARGSVYIYYEPNPTFAEACKAKGYDRFHGSNQFLFDYNSTLGQWYVRQIKSFSVCRTT